MCLERVLLAMGPRDEGHIESLTRTTADLVGPTGNPVTLFWASPMSRMRRLLTI